MDGQEGKISVLVRYLAARERLSRAHCAFRCLEGCSRPGCTERKLEVRVSLLDVLSIGLHIGEDPSAVFWESFSLGLFGTNRGPWTREVAVRLRKPCPFFAHPHCTIYPARPSACRLFPELQFAEGKDLGRLKRTLGTAYLCLSRPVKLSPKRKKAIQGLWRLYTGELITTSFFLFGSYPFCVDLSPLKAGFGQEMGSPSARCLDNETMEELFIGRLKRTSLWDELQAKIASLSVPHLAEELMRMRGLLASTSSGGAGSIEAKWIYEFDGDSLRPTHPLKRESGRTGRIGGSLQERKDVHEIGTRPLGVHHDDPA